MIHPSQKISPKRSSNYTFYQLRPLLLHHTEENTKPPKSLDHEPLIEDMPMFIPDLFTKEEYMNSAMFLPCRRSTSALLMVLKCKI